MAITAQEAIVAKAAPEYAHYLEVRKQAHSAHGSEASADGRASGASVAAVIAVLAPVLFGTAAAIFLLVGYVLRLASPRIAAASSLITTGWLFAAGTAASVLVTMISLLLTALRNASVSPSHEDGALWSPVMVKAPVRSLAYVAQERFETPPAKRLPPVGPGGSHLLGQAYDASVLKCGATDCVDSAIVAPGRELKRQKGTGGRARGLSCSTLRVSRL
ncbi:hypothetical protein [Streptomyces sp. AK02-04a]|uniref:hypothetical protein n=1 Tax=Streptomyces sp. AK02-04a TaxID=3028649 RepID=UPI0029B9AF2D|nr:hypothetical protein [Streptomyces sp. AK02-04a]MDX3762421.1 hypothetical protein [Streptomyces sp. AK02-04a]